jgi:hypothetical protein
MLKHISPTVLLLLIALFNAIAGVPLHYASHVQEIVAAATATELHADDAHDDPDHEEHMTCAWCLTHALDSPMGSNRASRPVAPEVHTAMLPVRIVTPRAQQIRWPFASRDPPAATLI